MTIRAPGATPHPPVGGSSPQGEPSSTPIESFWPRRGQTVGRRKSVKKNAALLHFLAFPSNDLPFGVLRGEQPLSRASRAIGSSGTLFGSFWGSKRNTWREEAHYKRVPPQGGGTRPSAKSKRRIHRCRNSNLRRPSGQLPQPVAQRGFLPGWHAPAKRYGVVKYRLFQPGTGCGDHPLGLLK